VTWVTRTLVGNLAPLAQLIICGPVGLIAAAAVICNFTPQREVALHLLETLRELKRKP